MILNRPAVAVTLILLAALAGALAWLLGFAPLSVALLAAGAFLLGWSLRASNHSSPTPYAAHPASDDPQSADTLRLIAQSLDALADPAMLIAPDGAILAVNAHAERFIGVGPLPGRSASEVFTRADLARAHEATSLKRWTARMPISDKERWIEATVSPAPPGVLLVLRDASTAAEASRVRTDFVANASHELRTPIAAIRAGLETLESGAADDPATARRLHAMLLAQVARLESIVRDLLDLARVEQSDLPLRVAPLRTTELEESLRAAFELAAAGRGLTLATDWGPAVDGVSTDPWLLALALRNLVENAAKYAYPDTTVHLRARAEHARLRIEVADRGVGIPVAHQQRVFERFYQVDPARSAGANRGAGLGLSIVRHVARAMGGSVGLSSVWKEGTTVWIETPIPPSPPDAETQPS